MNLYRYLKLTGLFILSMGIVTGCSINPLDLDENLPEDAPDIPNINQHQPDISYFQNNNPDNSEEFSNFNTATSVVTATSATLSAGLQLGTSFLSLAQTEGAEHNDGEWEWGYSHTYDGESISVRLEAESVNDNEVKWELYISSTNSDGENFEDYLFMEGTVASDGESGNWTIYPYEPGENSTASSTFNWEVESDTKKQLTFTNYQQQEWNMRMDYIENSPEFTITIETNDEEPTREIYWNTDDNTGYMTDGDQQMCWDANFENTTCS